jgi:WD40 repeat protein
MGPIMPARLPESAELRVFISYSRQNIAFVDRLEAALQNRGIKAAVDRTEIEKSEDWWKRIQELITEADTVVFVLSPTAVKSDICQQEVDFAEGLKKRFVPIVAESIDGLKVPGALARLNYIYFIADAASGSTGDFDIAAGQLVAALETDIGWIREHTRLGISAQRWLARGEARDLLLRGAELNAAENWITMRPLKAPDPSDAHRAFLAASRRAATLRQRWWITGSAAAAAGALALAGIAIVQAKIANEQRDEAGRQAGIANQQREAAETRRRETVALREQTQFTESGLLAKSAGGLLDDNLGGDGITAALLALEGLPDRAAGAGRPYVAGAEFQLDRALRAQHELRVLAGHEGAILSVAWSPDGGRIVTGSRDQTARVWEAATGKKLARIPSQGDSILSTSWTKDGKSIVTDDGSARSRSWDAATGNAAAGNNESARTSRERSPDGSLLFGVAVSDVSGTAFVVTNAKTNKIVKDFPSPEGGMTNFAWSPDGKRIATGSGQGIPRVWDAMSGKELMRFEGHEDAVNDLAWSPDGTKIVTASKDNTARIWNALTGKELLRLAGHEGAVNSVAWSPNGAWIATVSDDLTARIWAASVNHEAVRLEGYSHPVLEAAWSPDGNYIVTTASGEPTRIWNVADGKALINLGVQGPRRLAWNGDGKRILTISLENNVQLWDAASGRELTHFANIKSEVVDAAWFAEGARILTVSFDGTVQLWDAENGSELARTEGLAGDAIARSRSLNGGNIVDAVFDGTVELRSAITGKLLARLVGHEDSITSASLNPEGTRVVTASNDKTARVWDVAAGKELIRLDHGDSVESAAWSPDGRRIMTASNRSVRIWDAASGAELVRLDAGAEIVNAEWNPRGVDAAGTVLFVTAGIDGVVRVWRTYVSTQPLIQAAKSRSKRCLTPSQRKRYFLSVTPPLWCITGAGLEAETNPEKWRPVWPYQSAGWSYWLAAKQRGEMLPIPEEEFIVRNKLRRLISASDKLFAMKDYVKAEGLQEEIVEETRKNEVAQTGKPGGETASALLGASWFQLFAGHFEQALKSSVQAMELEPGAVINATNRAHALMFLGRIEEARALYIKYRGQRTAEGRGLWEEDIIKDFAELEKAGFTHPLMAEIRSAFSAAAENSAVSK